MYAGEIVSKTALHLYEFIEDAWEGGLRDWLRDAAGQVMQGRQRWMVVGSRGQARWLRKRALQEGLSLLGVQFMEPLELRQKLGAALKLEARPVGREILQMLLEIETPDCSQPGLLLQALDEVFSAGLPVRECLPQVSGELVEMLKTSRAWTPALDHELAATAAKLPLDVTLVGVGAEFSSAWNLLQALRKCAGRFAMFLPQPRDLAGIEFAWGERWAEVLGVEHEVCESTGMESRGAALMESMEGFGDVPDEGVYLLVGADWPGQIELVRDAVLSWLAESEPQQTMAVIAARRSPSTVQLARELQAAGVTFLDEIGTQPELPLLTAIQQQVVRYFRRGCDVEELCLLGALLERREDDPSRWQEYSEPALRRWSERAFEKVQSRNARLLAKAAPDHAVAQLVEALGSWEPKVTWSEARKNWQRAIEVLETGSQPLEPLWLRMAGLEVKGRFAADIFLRALESLLAGGKSYRFANHRYARVVLTTFRSAAEQAWDRVLFLDSQEGTWPLPPQENPFFNDAVRQRWNERLAENHPPLLTSLDRTALEQARIASLISHARQGVIFAACAVLTDGTEAHPNEWMMRVLALRGEPLKEWRRAVFRVQSMAGSGAGFESLKEVYAGRRDPSRPFDEYSFHLGQPEEPVAWAVTGLDTARGLPATFAVQTVLGLEPPALFQRSEPQVIGQMVHRWLGRALGGGDWHPTDDREGALCRLELVVRESAAKTAEWFRAEGLEVPLWWRSLLQKAHWLARRCLERVEPDALPWLAAEQAMVQAVETPAGPLLLKGRFDLVLSDQEEVAGAHWHIFDFKTGRTAPPTLARGLKGDGLQFVAYRLMARDAGAASAAVGMIRQDAIFEELFAGEEEAALREALAFAARMQATGCFGQLGPLRAERAGYEVLPVATTAIEPEILQRKWKATWGEDLS